MYGICTLFYHLGIQNQRLISNLISGNSRLLSLDLMLYHDINDTWKEIKISNK